MKTPPEKRKFSYTLLLGVFCFFFGFAPTKADHYKTVCTTPEAYVAISEYRIEEESRDVGKATKIGSLGKCFPVKRGTVVMLGKKSGGLACLLSNSWQGCRYIGEEFIKRALITSVRGFQKRADLKSYIYLGQ